MYPFLYGREGNIDAVLAEVRQSTERKAAEIVALRRQVLDHYADQLAQCAEKMAAGFVAGGRLFAFGNGGSSTDAQDVVSTFLNPPSTIDGTARPLPALCLTNDIAVVTALSNDVGFDVIFARELAASARAGDIAVGLSTSGNSANLVAAFEEASRRGLITVGLAGYDGGAMARLDTIDYLFVVSSASVHRIQEAQTTIYHVLWELTQRALLAQA
ncbi:MAG TPA: SIS domain-containing protein [Mycobacteriales bacterium]|nr:SIS domain-containing protein [Mycobacteriales bacterium]